jgi:hypothetical protein
MLVDCSSREKRHMAINVGQMHSDQCAVFLRGACVEAKNIHTHVVRHSTRREISLRLLICLLLFFYYYYFCLSLREKDGLFCLLSFFLSFFFFFFVHDGVNRKSGNVLRMFAQTNGKKRKTPSRFRPRKRSQSIIIYSHCIAQDHSRTHPKDYFRLMGL